MRPPVRSTTMNFGPLRNTNKAATTWNIGKLLGIHQPPAQVIFHHNN